MSLLDVNRFQRLTGAAVVSILYASVSGAQLPAGNVTDRPVPGAVLNVARIAGPLTLASALAQADVPAGFVLDVDETATTSALPSDLRLATRDTSLRDAATAFRQAHRAYRVAEADGVVVVEPMQPSACQAAVSRRMSNVSLRGSLQVALDSAFRQINPDHPTAPPGLVGDLGGESLPIVQVTLLSGTFRELLNAVARQTPGFVWVVRPVQQRGAQATGCAFEYFYHDLRFSAGWYVPLVKN